MKKTTKRAVLASGLVGVATVGVLASGGFAYAKPGGQDTASRNTANNVTMNRGSAQRSMNGQHEKHHQERLAKLVKDGKLTQAQADKLEAKQKAMMSKRQTAHRETDPAKRKTAREAMRAEMKQWAKDNDIDLNVIRPERSSKAEGRGSGGHMGMGRMMQSDRNDATPAQ
jgi:major membrane immunogen (membrane-anchored lipoprotein)